MKPEKILYAINDIDSEFLDEARAETAPKHHRSRRFAVLIAAVIALTAITVTAFAAEEVAGWFRRYFAGQSEVSLTPGQIEYIEDNEQIIGETQMAKGWSVELKSAITDGTKGLIILGVTAPEDISLETHYTEDGTAFSRLSMVDEWAKPVVYPEGFEEDVITWFFMDDGDGLKNTENFIIEVQPKPEEGSREPFAPDAQWKVVLNDIVRITDNVELLKEISNEQGEYCYEGEISTTEVLLEGCWEFNFRFRAENAQEADRELLAQPVVTTGQVYKRGDDGKYAYALDDVTVTSVKLSPLSATITYEFSGLYPAFEWDGAAIHAVMKDGSKILLEDNWSRWDGYNVLKARTPIVLDEVDHILLADGTKIMAP